jgi:hypothetical protein
VGSSALRLVNPIVFRLAFYLFWHILFGGFAAPYFGE